jgi:hypothetical protein
MKKEDAIEKLKRRKTIRKNRSKETEPESGNISNNSEQVRIEQDTFQKSKSMNIEFNFENLIHNALSKWKKEFENDIVRTDSISDLEKLIKLDILVKDENRKSQDLIDKIMTKIIETIKILVEDPDLKIKIFEKFKEIKYEEFIGH